MDQSAGGQHMHQDSKTSSEDSDQQQDQDDASTGRSYGCVFCKRGFTTAQALGGHMNIHRKDRARIRQPAVPSVSTGKPDNEYVSPAPLPPPPTSTRWPLYRSPPREAQTTTYHVYLPPSSSGTRHPPEYHADEFHLQRPQPLSPFDEHDWRTNLSLQLGPTHTKNGGEGENKREAQEDEPDLELRLGHDP
ncbi:PREDICTED: transcriptional regulator SUPERMAN-like [Nelumbo nucifera]|uniref:Transcriptional regulator SUPERMAN-like n=2 Tax=Nelumbo nucifera TaxID=4432 RepID=A0A1U8BEM4_NELNU|nr:PREDICTED: transcriptional regulator SUPERMAN-like [Nelumbo nucifera]DAD19826.1 TPA_asm: hypothetical protein HUJ06_021289 [Nelumbo nucifera]